MAEHEHFDVQVLTPEGEVFSGDVEELSTRTGTGEIGIRARHAPLLGALEPTELRLHISDSEVERYAQAHGWIQVFGNHALLLVEEAVPPDQLDPSSLRDQLEDAVQRLGEAEEGSAVYNRAQKDMRRAQAFLAIAEGS
jgi:F-type H+-transporting ATPase subunit epsilon